MKDCMKVSVIQWLDARVSIDGTSPTLPLMTSIGVITHQDKEKIILCSMFGENKDQRVLMAIPKVLIRSIKKINKFSTV